MSRKPESILSLHHWLALESHTPHVNNTGWDRCVTWACAHSEQPGASGSHTSSHVWTFQSPQCMQSHRLLFFTPFYHSHSSLIMSSAIYHPGKFLSIFLGLAYSPVLLETLSCIMTANPTPTISS